MKSIICLLFVNVWLVGRLAMADEPAKADSAVSLVETTKTAVKIFGGFCPDLPGEPGNITHWKFVGKRITGKRMEKLVALLEQFPLLQRLDLEDNPITDKDIDCLVAAKIELVELNLDKTRITDKSLAVMAERYPSLNSLGLNLTAITDDGLKALEPLDMHYLHIGGTKVTDAGMKSVACWVNLRDLNIAQTRVTGKGLAAMMVVEMESDSFKKLLLEHRSGIDRWLASISAPASASGSNNYPNNQSQNYFDRSASEFEIDLLKLDIKDVDWLERGRGVQGLERLWWARSGLTYRDLICLQVCSPKKIAFQFRADF